MNSSYFWGKFDYIVRKKLQFLYYWLCFFSKAFYLQLIRRKKSGKAEKTDKVEEVKQVQEKITNGKENNKEMFCIEREVLRTYVIRQGRKKKIKMSKRARYIGRDYDEDAFEKAIQKQIAKLNCSLGK